MSIVQSELDSLAQTRGWEILDASSSEAPMASYYRKEDGTRLNFWLTTGTVGSYLDHPHQGKTQLFRRKIDMSQASELFDNPRQHTGAGYHTKEQQQQKIRPKKREQILKHQTNSSEPGARCCASCKITKSSADFSKNQRRKGSSARCKSCVD